MKSTYLMLCTTRVTNGCHKSFKFGNYVNLLQKWNL